MTEKEYAPSAKERKQATKNAAKAPVQTAQKAEVKPAVKPEVKKEETVKVAQKSNDVVADNKSVQTTDTKSVENKSVSDTKPTEAKPAEVKKETKKQIITKKEEAIARGLGIAASKKHSMAICDYIKGKSIDQSIAELHQVIKLKRAIPMVGEIPHRHGKGMMSGRYPVDTSKIFINILKALKGNVIVNGLDLEKTRIYFGSASWASRPRRAGGITAKRTNVILKAKEFPMPGEKK